MKQDLQLRPSCLAAIWFLIASIIASCFYAYCTDRLIETPWVVTIWVMLVIEAYLGIAQPGGF